MKDITPLRTKKEKVVLSCVSCVQQRKKRKKRKKKSLITWSLSHPSIFKKVDNIQ